MKYLTLIVLAVIFVTGSSTTSAQQLPDDNFHFEIKERTYPGSDGPIISIDEAHLNFHTLEGRYSAFAKVLAGDGYRLTAGKEKFTEATLKQSRILVIANPLGDTGEWKLPTLPAFSDDEVESVQQWVSDGGSLFLIADHMPCAGAAAKLAAAFGFNFINGFAMRNEDGPEMFSRQSGNLLETPVTKGRNKTERIETIQMFTGSAFLPPPDAAVITKLGKEYTIELASVAWQFSETTPKISGMHFANGAMLQYGKGRVVVFGEAAMFTAQVQGPEKRKMGMSLPSAKENPQLLLNIIHWLDGKL
jgi:hypothetical protein